MRPPFQRYPLALRIILMFSMFLFNMGIVQMMALFAAQKIFNLENTEQVLEGNFTQTHAVSAFIFIQGISSIGGFMLTAMMFAVLESGEFKNHLRIKSFPFNKTVEDFINDHDKIYLIEQNRDAQMKSLLMIELQADPNKFISVLNYDGTPITAEMILRQVSNKFQYTF